MWEKYKKRVQKGEDPGKILDDLGIDKYCCRTLFMTHRDVIKKTSKFRV